VQLRGADYQRHWRRREGSWVELEANRRIRTGRDTGACSGTMLAMQRTTWTLVSALRPNAHTKRCFGRAAASRGASTLGHNGIAVTARREREVRGRRVPSLERSLWKPWAKSDQGIERDAISSLFNKGNDLSRHRPATVVTRPSHLHSSLSARALPAWEVLIRLRGACPLDCFAT